MTGERIDTKHETTPSIESQVAGLRQLFAKVPNSEMLVHALCMSDDEK